MDSGSFSYEIPVQEQGSVDMMELELLFHSWKVSCAVVAERPNTSKKTFTLTYKALRRLGTVRCPPKTSEVEGNIKVSLRTGYPYRNLP